jgi:hypothetical protein
VAIFGLVLLDAAQDKQQQAAAHKPATAGLCHKKKLLFACA